MAESKLSIGAQVATIWSLGGLTIKQVAKKVAQGLSDDFLLDRAAALAFNFILVLFPFMVFLLSIFNQVFPDPASAFSVFDLTFPGQSGSRNVVRGDGFFTIDAALSKRSTMSYNERQGLQFRVGAFNITNSVRFDVNQLSLSMSNSVSFGKYNGTLNTPRVIQFGAGYEF